MAIAGDWPRLYVQTRVTSRKAPRLLADPRVAIVIGWQLDKQETVQIEGVAKQLSSRSEIAEAMRQFSAKDSPSTPYYLNHPEALIFCIKPNWVRYSNYSLFVPLIWEVSTAS